MQDAMRSVFSSARSACLAVVLLGTPVAAISQDASAAVDPLQTDILQAYGVLVGAWRPDPASLSDVLRRWRSENNISENWVEFAWGADRQWMLFGDWQRKDGANRHAGAGLVAYDPASHRVMFTEHSIRGASIVGTLERISPTEIVRDIVVSRTDRDWRQIDRWVWKAGNETCFDWFTTYVNGDTRSEQPPSRWCRMPTTTTP